MGRKSMKCVGGKERCQQEMPLLTCVSYLGVSQALPPPAPSAFIYFFFCHFSLPGALLELGLLSPFLQMKD